MGKPNKDLGAENSKYNLPIGAVSLYVVFSVYIGLRPFFILSTLDVFFS